MAILILGVVAALLLAILAMAALAGWIAKKRGGSKLGWRVFALALLVGYGVPAAKIFIDRRAYDVACKRDTGVFIYKVVPGVRGYYIDETDGLLTPDLLERPRRFEFVEGTHRKPGKPQPAVLSRIARDEKGEPFIVAIDKTELKSDYAWRIRYETRHGTSHGFGYRITEVFRISDGEVIGKTVSVVAASNLETGSWKIWQLRGPCIELRDFPPRTDFRTHVFPE
jgi:hypothetical protein